MTATHGASTLLTLPAQYWQSTVTSRPSHAVMPGRWRTGMPNASIMSKRLGLVTGGPA